MEAGAPSTAAGPPALAQAPEHEKALRSVLHQGGLNKGAKVWVPVREGIGWVRARILAKEDGGGGLTTFTLEEENGGGKRTLKSQRRSDGHFPDVHLVNEELDMAASEGEAGAIDDLIKLTHLHEPAILHTIELRYWRDTIYTFTGPILIAVNPFKPLGIYSSDVLATYRTAGQEAAARLAGQQSSQSQEAPPLPPHIYAVADAAYRAMTGPLVAGQGSPNQSILVSGESGAGKTESTKFIMQYLAIISTANGDGALSKGVEEGSIADQVLQSNPILEAFGNARTIRNDNSSRFGKFIELHFAPRTGQLTGAAIATYLLEKVRLVSQQERERSFHVFYQLLKGASEEERGALGLGAWDGGKGAQGFHYLRQSGCVARQDGADDAEEYARLRKALAIMGVSEEEQARVLRVVAAVLHLGNLRFALKPATGNNPDAAEVAPDAVGTARRVAELLGVDAEAFQRSLTDRTIQAGRETVNVKLTPAQAEGARDALAKAIYGNLFLWIVDRVNAAIWSQHQQSQGAPPATPLSVRTGGGGKQQFVGILDIFGFESFQTNSFEQLCINYANETLQQHFNSFVFRLEQEEYEREEISWSFVEFPDNQECLDLLENKTSGIFSLLDEQCTVPKGTDQSLANRLYDKCGAHPRFTVSSKDRVDFKFTIRHYAGDVTYDTLGFLEKNKDQLFQETVDLLSSSASPLVQALADASPSPASPGASAGDGSSSGGGGGLGGSGGKRRSAVAPQTVGTQFKGQLALLLARIRSTRPHYVRCLKPNDQNVPAAFDCPRIIEQLRCGGVLEAVRVSRAGYPTRMLHAQFKARYRPLALDAVAAVVRASKGNGNSGKEAADPAAFERRLAEAVIAELGQILWAKRREEGLLPLPSEEERAALPLREQLAHVGLQLGKSKIFFRLQAFEELETMRGRLMRAMAVKCQAVLRGWVRRKAYLRTRDAALLAQRLARGYLARRRARHLRETLAATRIQSAVRAQQARRRLKAGLRVVLALQCLWRREQAKRALVALREDKAAVKVQAWARGRLGQRRLCQTKRATLAVQTHFRRQVAKKEVRRRRAEARDLGKVMAERDELKAAVRALRTELEEALAERDGRIRALEEEKAEQGERIRALEAELEEARHLAEAKTQAAPGSPVREEEGKQSLSPPASPARSKATQTTAVEAAAGAGERDEAAEEARLTSYRERIQALEAQLAAAQTGVDRYKSSAEAPAFSRGQTRSDSFVTAVSELGGSGGNGGKGDMGMGRASSLALADEEEEGAAGMEDEEAASEGSVSPAQTVEEAAATEEAAAADAAASLLGPPPTPATGTGLGAGPADLKARFLSSVSDMPAKAFLLTFAKAAEETDAVVANLEERLGKEDPAVLPELVNATDKDGRTPLHLAAAAGNARIVDLLLRHGAGPNQYDKRDDTPLHLSASEAVTKELLAHGANPGLPNRVKEVALHVAVRHRDPLAVHALLEKPAHRRYVNERDDNKRTPLHLAASLGLTDAVALLCEYEAHKEAADAEGLRPLHLICKATLGLENGPGIVHFLLDRGADPCCRNARGLTPLHLLCDNPAYVSHEAAVCEMADDLLDKGVSPDVAASDGSTPLHLAAWNNYEELSALLIRRGACLTIPWRVPGSVSGYDSSQESPTRSRAGSIASYTDCSPSGAAAAAAAMAGAADGVGSESPLTTAAEIFTERSPAQLQRMIGEITAPQEAVQDAARAACMECKAGFTLLNRRHHCRFCQRLLCGDCAGAQLPRELFPPSFTSDTRPHLRVCHVCFAVLTRRQEKKERKKGGGSGSGGGGSGPPVALALQEDATQYVNLQEVVRARRRLAGVTNPEATALTTAAVEARAGEAPVATPLSNGSGGLGSPTPGSGGGAGGGKKKKKKKKGGGGGGASAQTPQSPMS